MFLLVEEIQILCQRCNALYYNVILLYDVNWACAIPHKNSAHTHTQHIDILFIFAHRIYSYCRKDYRI